MKILIVDDEEKITEVIEAYLSKENYCCTVAHNGMEAMKAISEEEFQVIILDRMLPDISGEEICKRAREKSGTHIIMLTAKAEEEHRIEGFTLGCDDYVCKPFNVKELVLRVKAVGRRFKDEDILNFDGELQINKLSHEIKVRGEEVILTNTEYKILLTLAMNPKKLFTREELLQLSLEDYYEKFDRVIDAHVKNLRQKIEVDTRKPRIIQTVYGVGYKFGL